MLPPEVTPVSGSLMRVGSHLLSAAPLCEGGKRVGIFQVALPSLRAPECITDGGGVRSSYLKQKVNSTTRLNRKEFQGIFFVCAFGWLKFFTAEANLAFT